MKMIKLPKKIKLIIDDIWDHFKTPTIVVGVIWLSCWLSWHIFITIPEKKEIYEYDKIRKERPYSKEEWKPEISTMLTINGDYPRCYMYKDLIKNHLYIGMSEKEVRELLGGQTISIRKYNGTYVKRYGYLIGKCTKSGFSFTTDGLQYWGVDMILDADNKVIAIKDKDKSSDKKFRKINEESDLKITCHEDLDEVSDEDTDCTCYGLGPESQINKGFRLPLHWIKKKDVEKECGIRLW